MSSLVFTSLYVLFVSRVFATRFIFELLRFSDMGLKLQWDLSFLDDQRSCICSILRVGRELIYSQLSKMFPNSSLAFVMKLSTSLDVNVTCVSSAYMLALESSKHLLKLFR